LTDRRQISTPGAEKVSPVYQCSQSDNQDDEPAYKVELIAGKTVEVDEGNRYFFGGTIKKVTIEDWGFPRYNVGKLGPMAGTLMAIDK